MSHPARSTSRVLASPTVAIVGGGGRSGTQAPAGATAKASEKDRARDGWEEEPGPPRRVRGRDRAGFARARPVGVARGAAVTGDGKAAGAGQAEWGSWPRRQKRRSGGRQAPRCGRRRRRSDPGPVEQRRTNGYPGNGYARGTEAPAEPGTRARRAPRPRAPGQERARRATGMPGTGTGRSGHARERAAAERWAPAGARAVAGKRRVAATCRDRRSRPDSRPAAEDEAAAVRAAPRLGKLSPAEYRLPSGFADRRRACGRMYRVCQLG